VCLFSSQLTDNFCFFQFGSHEPNQKKKKTTKRTAEDNSRVVPNANLDPFHGTKVLSSVSSPEPCVSALIWHSYSDPVLQTNSYSDSAPFGSGSESE